MSREIKFRAFDTSRKKMYTAEELGQDQMSIDPGGGGFYNPDPVSTSRTQWYKHLVPMQFTGLKDKNGKEIYEGDIVRWDDRSKGKYWRVAEVFYDDTQAIFSYRIIDCINCKIEKGYVFGGNFAYRDGSELEVMGNIYETTELIHK